MRTLAPTVDSFGLRGTGFAVSTEAERLFHRMKNSYDHLWEPRLNVLVPLIESLADRSPDAESVADAETVAAGIEFVYCLPRLTPLPLVSVDPDGEISFDWVAPSGHEMFSVRVDSTHRLAYAGWFGETSRVHGIEQLSEKCPIEIIRGIQKATGKQPKRGN